MSEHLIQKNFIEVSEKIEDWNFYNIGDTTFKVLKGEKIISSKDYDKYDVKSDTLIVWKLLFHQKFNYRKRCSNAITR